jgi:hypothetical protein
MYIVIIILMNELLQSNNKLNPINEDYSAEQRVLESEGALE